MPLHASLPDAIRAISVDADETSSLQRIVALAVREVAGSELGGVCAIGRNAIHTRAASHPRVELLDRVQYATGEGPCLTAAATDAPVVVSGDLESDERWPEFGRAAADIGVRSSISFKLFDGRDSIGALTLYAAAPGAFPPSAEQCGALLAAHAAVVMAASRKQANLAVALESRDVIGQAKGILMERYKLSDREAFETLIAVSQHTHRKLRDVADQLRTNGVLPGFE